MHEKSQGRLGVLARAGCIWQAAVASSSAQQCRRCHAAEVCLAAQYLVHAEYVQLTSAHWFPLLLLHPQPSPCVSLVLPLPSCSPPAGASPPTPATTTSSGRRRAAWSALACTHRWVAAVVDACWLAVFAGASCNRACRIAAIWCVSSKTQQNAKYVHAQVRGPGSSRHCCWLCWSVCTL